MNKKKKIFMGLLATLSFGVFSTVSAESYIASQVPESFTTRQAGRIKATVANGANFTLAIEEGRDACFNNDSIAINSFDYHTTTGLKVFCYDMTKEYAPGSEYVYKEKLTDATAIVVAYVIANADAYYTKNLSADADFPNGNIAGQPGGPAAGETIDTTRALEKSWFTQMAVWKAVHTDFYNKNDANATLREWGGDYHPVYSLRAVLLFYHAGELVNQAKNYKPSSEEKVTFDFDQSYNLDTDNKVIKTGLIKVSNVENGTINLSKVPSGTKVYDKDGKEINNGDKIVGEFYLVIPVDNSNDYSFNFDVSVSGEVTGNYDLHEYVRTEDPTGAQPLVLVTQGKKPASGSLHIETSKIEDTSSIIATSVYFVGFMVLLAGLGVIYINVRPKKEQI